MVSLSGFAYGMKGFFISSTASVVGSAIAFVVMRAVLKERLQKLSRGNEKWAALESVVVSLLSDSSSWAKLCFIETESQRAPADNISPSLALPTMGLLQCIIRSEFQSSGVGLMAYRHRVLSLSSP